MEIEGLAFRAPDKLVRLAREATLPVLPPVQWDALQGPFMRGGNHRLPVAGEAREVERRNVLIWFLLAAGVDTRTVSDLFELSTSRCRSIAAKCIKRLHVLPVVASKILNKTMSSKDRKYHIMHDSMTQMLVAEKLLQFEDWYREVGYCLNMGRKRYVERFAEISGDICTCKLCGGGQRPEIQLMYQPFIYWPEC